MVLQMTTRPNQKVLPHMLSSCPECSSLWERLCWASTIQFRLEEEVESARIAGRRRVDCRTGFSRRFCGAPGNLVEWAGEGPHAYPPAPVVFFRSDGFGPNQGGRRFRKWLARRASGVVLTVADAHCRVWAQDLSRRSLLSASGGSGRGRPWFPRWSRASFHRVRDDSRVWPDPRR